jgi:hypothetical protein
VVGFYDEACATLARIVAYLGAVALLVIACLGLLGSLRLGGDAAPSAPSGFSLATRSAQAFAVSQFDFVDKTESYEVFRHPLGGRKDVVRWVRRDDEGPLAELEIYRPGGEFDQTADAGAELIARMSPARGRAEAAGVLDSKFGTVTLLRNTGDRDPAQACLGFLKRFDEPSLRISGWSCQGDGWPARRTAIDCLLNRLVLLSAGNDPRLAQLFADAELRRGSCASAMSASTGSDWLSTPDNPGLRGAL